MGEGEEGSGRGVYQEGVEKTAIQHEQESQYHFHIVFWGNVPKTNREKSLAHRYEEEDLSVRVSVALRVQ